MKKKMNHQSIAQRKLQKLREKGIKVFGLDYDGTVFDRKDPHYNHHQTAIELTLKIAARGAVPALITARDASIKRILVPPLLEASRSGKIKKIPIFIAGGNGSNLIEIKNGKRREIYNYGLTRNQIKTIISLYNELQIKDFEPEAKTIFENFLKQDWSEYIPSDFLKIAKNNPGIWVEQSKVSLVLPSNQKLQRDIINTLRKELGDKLAVIWANDDFAHIIQRLEKDSKLTAIEAIIQELAISKENIATFGDSPEGNDVGLLSLPYSFTNYFELEKQDMTAPPYILRQTQSPIESVYRAIDFLLS